MTIQAYFSMMSKILLGLGLVFEMPMLMFFLARLGVITAGQLLRGFRWAVLGIFVTAAIITPTPDIATQTVFDDAASALEEALETVPSGPRLERQIASLEAALDRASTPVAVVLESDATTEVMVYRGFWMVSWFKKEFGHVERRLALKEQPDVAVAIGTAPDGLPLVLAVQRSANAIAVGPVLQGLRKPVNDLSRGALVADIVNTVAMKLADAMIEAMPSNWARSWSRPRPASIAMPCPPVQRN